MTRRPQPHFPLSALSSVSPIGLSPLSPRRQSLIGFRRPIKVQLKKWARRPGPPKLVVVDERPAQSNRASRVIWKERAAAAPPPGRGGPFVPSTLPLMCRRHGRRGAGTGQRLWQERGSWVGRPVTSPSRIAGEGSLTAVDGTPGRCHPRGLIRAGYAQIPSTSRATTVFDVLGLCRVVPPLRRIFPRRPTRPRIDSRVCLTPSVDGT